MQYKFKKECRKDHNEKTKLMSIDEKKYDDW